MSLNKVMLIGRLGQDPELKQTNSGNAVCNFSLATSESWNDRNGQKQERTEWHRCVAWQKKAEILAKYLHQGKQIYIEGKLQTRSWEDQQGEKKYTTEVLIENFTFIGGSNQNNTQEEGPDEGDGLGWWDGFGDEG